MEIIQNISDLSCDASAVAIGKFDGVHIGHQALLHDIIKQKAEGMKAVVFTFYPSPNAFFGMQEEKEITTQKEKREILKSIGVDLLIEYPMNEKTASQLPEDFIREILSDTLKTKVITAGPDISYGKYGAGNLALLKELSEKFHYDIHIIPKKRYGEEEISSSYIRENIAMGKMREVEVMLGHPYCFEGIVIHGRHQGTGLGMPTVNIEPDRTKILPPFGVYYSNVIVRDTKYRAITNIGKKPTISDHLAIGLESYIYDFNQDVYGEKIRIELLQFDRPEVKFSSMDELKSQLEKDKMNGLNFNF